ncbi:MAG: PepSY domain-containing protein [Sphingobium sp.]
MLKPVLVLHRWLGVVVGAIMTLWCLSGFVMMYADYPRLLPAEQLRGLAPLTPVPADGLARVALPDDIPLASARVEMMAGRPVLRIVPAIDPGRPIAQMRVTPDAFDLATGEPLAPLSATDIAKVAASFGRESGIAGGVGAITETGIDQWTVQAYRRNAPLYRIDYADPAGSQAYVSGRTGEVVQTTTRIERFWGWLGAVPHWLYPTILRQNGQLWDHVVVWTSLAGCFLTVTGLWAGIARLRRKRDGTIGSPFRRLWWWHHIFGLWFGLFTLTWVASGLFSMNPWGFLDSMAGFAERQRLAGTMHWGEVRNAIAVLPRLPQHAVRLETAPLGGQLHMVATAGDGQSVRLAANGNPAPLGETELRRALRRGPPLASLDLLREEDSYYYSHKVPASLPVWRAVLRDAEQTRLYIAPVSGRLIRTFDSNQRKFRWLQDGLHSLDLPVLRTRPIWDLVVLPLLAMVTIVCATGTWMGFGKVRRDLRRFRRRLLAGTWKGLPPRTVRP